MKKLSIEEIQGKLQGFPDAFKERFGRELDKDLLINYLQNELKVIEQRLITEAFSNLHPESIRNIIDELTPQINDESLHIVPKKQRTTTRSKRLKEINDAKSNDQGAKI